MAATVWLVFQFALPGIVQFDDKANLAGLASIDTLDAAWRWLLQGNAGPTGRPLSLASFALQYYQWPDSAPLLEWNIAIHAINTLLVFWLAILATGRVGGTESLQLAVGFLTALLWATLPLLNTSILFIVQRMTLLSASFVLAGLIVYLKLRGPADASWRRQFGAVLALAICGGLSLLAKESGALIVVYALVLELLILRKHSQHKVSWAALMLLLANLVLLGALAGHASWSEGTQLRRGYAMPDRLGSQGLILLVYLKGLFLPAASDLNPYRFEQFLDGGINVRWGIAVWAALMALPIVAWLRRWHMLALALAWFFYGHIMESGWVALEPYFAHRNYLPALGLVFALVFWVLSRPSAPGIWRAGIVGYAIALLSVTWMNTSLWGNRALAAEIWAMEQPKSIRAALNLGYELERTQGLGVAQHYLDRFMREQADSTGLRLQSLISACHLSPDADHSQMVRDVTQAIRTLPYEGWATDLMQDLTNAVRTNQCRSLSLDQIAEIASAFLGNPVYRTNSSAVHNLLLVLGAVATQQQQPEEAMDFFSQALEKSMSYSVAGIYLDLAKNQGDVDSIRKLKALMEKAGVPRGATPDEWRALRDRVDAALR